MAKTEKAVRAPRAAKAAPVVAAAKTTKQRSIRVPDERWARSLATAQAKGESLAAKINEFLDSYATAAPVKAKPGRKPKATIV